jgi:hypothetical protein
MLGRLATGTKWCPRCKRWLLLSQFYETPSRAGDGYSSLCRACTRTASAERKARIELEAARQAELNRRSHPAHHGRAFAAELPPPPDWSRGTCTLVPASQRSWWTSEDRDERQAAARMCAGCEIREQCAEWSMSLPVTDDAAVYAGLLPAERLRRKRELLHEIAIAVRGTQPRAS